MNDFSFWLNPEGGPSLQVMLSVVAGLAVIWGIIKGVGRLVLLVLSLASGAVAAWTVYRYAPGAFIAWLGGFSVNALNWTALVCGLLVMWFVRRFLNALITGRGVWRPASGTGNGLLSLLPALLLVWAAAMALCWTGGVSRMRLAEAAVKANRAEIMEDPPLLARMRTGLSKGVPGEFLDRLDPLHSSDISALGALLTVRHNDRAWTLLQKQPQVTPPLREALRRLLNDKGVAHTLSFSHYSELLTLPEVKEALKSPGVRQALDDLRVEETIQSVLPGAPAVRR